ncbi:hypothetical protein CCAX7_34920 [Capsulimonas corticalis]|uniref:Uncharacterized protein n=1 Tax=Capsulimonas corticalis TaxID=2219043 RepID=A0A402CY42_9BACT|nr:hypothetical protein [Capsulimonas corticalis]BDI31441.1 hypothetical protein CCAX7_34920 [Capsulimonas corticalis]
MRRTKSLEQNNSALQNDDILSAVDKIIGKYGRSGSGRASALRLIGAYVIIETEGISGLRKRGFSRGSIQLYLEKLHDVDVRVP